MSRSRGYKKDYRDPRGAHVRIYKEIIDSPAWRSLTPTEVALYVAMRSTLGAKNNGDISAALSDMKKHNIRSSSTLAKGLRSLETLGLIAKTRQGGITAGSKLCSLYRFTDDSMHDNPELGLKYRLPSNEWKEFKHLADCRRALQIAHETAKRPSSRNGTKLRKPKAIDSVAEAQRPCSASIGEADAPASLRETNTVLVH